MLKFATPTVAFCNAFHCVLNGDLKAFFDVIVT